MNAKLIYGTAWYLHQGKLEPWWLMIRRKKERTTALVVSAVLAGFRAIDTGKLSSVLYFMARLKGTWFPACQPKHYRSVLLSR